MDDNKSPFNTDPLTLFIQSLLIKKEGIEKTIESLKRDRQTSEQHKTSSDLFEELDRANNELSTQQFYILLERKYSELKKIEAILKKVSKYEDFGWCEECGDRISLKRLSVMPDATMCIHCQREYEKMEFSKGHTTRVFKKLNEDEEIVEENIEEMKELRALLEEIDHESLSMDDLELLDLSGDLS